MTPLSQPRAAYLLGSPVSHSRSPELHQAAYQALGQPWTYSKREVVPEELGATLQELAGEGLLGINLTLPLKTAAFDHVVDSSPQAKKVGAINCLRWSAEGWHGHNTDADGWLDSWNQEIGLPLRGRPAVILGAGGACKAILSVLRQAGVSDLVLLNRTPERARQLLEASGHHHERVEEWSAAAFTRALLPNCVVVQTSSVGMWPNSDAVPLAWPEQLPPGLVACDLIYNPRPTLWLKQAQDRGAQILDGSGMLVHQAARAIEWWSGQLPPTETMMRVLRDSLR